MEDRTSKLIFGLFLLVVKVKRCEFLDFCINRLEIKNELTSGERGFRGLIRLVRDLPCMRINFNFNKTGFETGSRHPNRVI